MTQPLPFDILCMLFAHLRHNDLEGFNDYCDLIFASHVCKRWRQAAIDDSSLWHHINVGLIQNAHVLTFIARAKHHPLSVRVKFYGDVHQMRTLREFSAVLDVISGYWNRIRALSLICGISDGSHLVDLASSWIGSTCSKRGLPSSLESLHIYRDKHGISYQFLEDLLDHPLPESLKVLNLNRSPIPLHFSTLTRLTELSLISTVSVFRPKAWEIVEVLRSSPDLEVLHFDPDFMYMYSEESLVKPVSLPRLRSLSLSPHIHAPDSLVLLEKMDFSPDAKVRLNVQTFLGIALLLLPPSFASTLRASQVSASMVDGALTMDLHAVRSNSSLEDATVHIQANLPGGTGIPHKQAVVGILCHTLQKVPWSRPTRLKVDISQCPGDPPNWPLLFENLSSLVSMEVQVACAWGDQETWRETEAAIELISALNTPETEQAVCPNLRRLVFPAFDRNQLTEKFSEAVKAYAESRESRGLPYVDIVLGILPALDA